MCKINVYLLYAFALAGLLAACSSTVTQPDDGDAGMDGGANCIDHDGDGFGVYCPLGPDCNDRDPGVSTGCAVCYEVEEGCLCDPEQEPEPCYPDYEMLSGGEILCHEGVRYCYQGRWSGCESVESYLLSARSHGGKLVLPPSVKEAYCWGSNANGQLGDNTTSNSSTPKQVVGVGGSDSLSGVEGVSAGDLATSHSCAVTETREVFCWGLNISGQLGDGTNTNSESPVEVTGMGLAKQVSVGAEHTCARDTGGGVWCWGRGADGRLGDTGTSDSNVPVAVKAANGSDDLTGATKVAVGANHACAITAQRLLLCWGNGSSGEVGNGASGNAPTPVYVHRVNGGGTCSAANQDGCLKNVVDVSAGDTHTCAVLAGGQAVCWGANGSGQLGDNSTTGSAVPVNVLGIEGSGLLDDASGVSAGGLHTCAVRGNSRVACWGENDTGQLGNGDGTGLDRLVPVEVYLQAATSPQGGGMCFLDTYTGHDYWFCDGDAKNWAAADTACDSVGMDLARVDGNDAGSDLFYSEQENDFIQSRISADSWLGGQDATNN